MKDNVVRDGYDKVAATYLANRDRLKTGKYVQQLLKYLPKKSTILDLGCGAGVPVDDILMKAGHELVGIDVSSQQIKLARKNCIGGQYLVGDLVDLRENEYQVQAVVSFYTLFHISREQHPKILKIVASFLPPHGLLLITMGDREFEGQHLLHGVQMWSSQHGTVKNRKMIESSGFKILLDEIDISGGERHQIIMAEKI
jgi:cyclopropane fatty-acyl-phospholipid synthase-like methyltransferase